MLYARTQEQIYANIRSRVRDTPPSRWTAAEIYAAINSALDTWDNRVLIPHVFVVDWVTNQREYTLPVYVKKPLDPQYKISGGEETWCDFNAYQIRPNTDGTLTLHLSFYPTPGDGRVIWWAPNSRLPAENPTLLVDIDADDASLQVGDEVDVDENGHVRIGNEWIGYAGVTQEDGSRTLTGLERGALGTTAASHVAATPVLWGIVVQRMDLYAQLERQIQVYLHEQFLTDGSAHETETHERIMNWHQQQIDRYWTKFVPARSPKIVLSAQGIGGPLYAGGRVFPATGDRASFP